MPKIEGKQGDVFIWPEMKFYFVFNRLGWIITKIPEYWEVTQKSPEELKSEGYQMNDIPLDVDGNFVSKFVGSK